MSDYIKREDAIDIVKNLRRFSCFGDDGFVQIPMVYCELMEVESADVAPVRHGRWVVIDAEELGRRLYERQFMEMDKSLRYTTLRRRLRPL